MPQQQGVKLWKRRVKMTATTATSSSYDLCAVTQQDDKWENVPSQLNQLWSRHGWRVHCAGWDNDCRQANPLAGFPKDRTVFIASVMVMLSSLFCLRMIGWSYRAGDPEVGGWGTLRPSRWGDLRGLVTAGTRAEGSQLPDSVSLFSCLSQWDSSQVKSTGMFEVL